MRLIDNKQILLYEHLNQLIDRNTEIFLSLRFFSVYGLFSIIDTIKKANCVKILIDQEDDENFLKDASESSLDFNLDRKFKLRQVKEIVKKYCEVRKGGIGNQNIIIIKNGNGTKVFTLTPLNLTAQATGEISAPISTLISELDDVDNQYLQLFHNVWDNSKMSLNKRLDLFYDKKLQRITPEDIYKYSIRNIFQHTTVNERAERQLEKTGFKHSKIWKLLYNFQKDAVIGAIDKIETYGGCIIADSVGLGKTFEALAVMKYYQLRNSRILVLAPKKLRENWTLYNVNDKRNLLAEDRFNFDVLNHTDLSREKGYSGDIDLEMVNWGNYDLVVIDESHNFRNNPNKKGLTRYKRLMNDVIRANIRTKVLMLSATPVNNKLNDLKNQISFITEGDDEAFSEHGITSITNVMRETQSKFNKWIKDGHVDDMDVDALLEKLDGSYFKILDMVTIARSRKHVEKYYDTTEVGEFPERLKPKTIRAELDRENKVKDISKIYDEISLLTLASYTPLTYVRHEKMQLYEDKYDMATEKGSIFKQIDREQSLIYLMRVNLLKRLESSIYSFKLTLNKLIKLITHNIDLIEKNNKSNEDLDLNITDIEIDDTDLEDMLVGGKTKVLVQDMDTIRWQQDLENDLDILNRLQGLIELLDVNRDAKLLTLKNVIQQKVENPINNGNLKVIIFTAFSDTASYLYENLSTWIKEELGLRSALVTGSETNKTNLNGVKTDLNSILTNFSPVSKKRGELYDNSPKEEIDVLFCTDCISEGQNLQDCDYLINYDIHWNPVRIIQRFGRIDRIGSKNKQIQLVNFYPNIELDSFIELIAKVKGRMVMLDVSASGEENIIKKDSKEMQDLDYRKRQLQKLQEQVIDLEDIDGNISITDLTFNDFKIDIDKTDEHHLKRIDELPTASYSVTVPPLEQIKPGVIFCFKEDVEQINVHPKDNLLYPYYLVYISEDGETILKARDTKKVLDYFRKSGMGNRTVNSKAWSNYNIETKNDRYTGKYKKMVDEALIALQGDQKEIGLDALAKPGVQNFSNPEHESKDKMKLLSYLILK